MMSDRQASILKVGEEYLDLNDFYYFRGCTASIKGEINFESISKSGDRNGYYQVLSFNGDWYLDDTRVDIAGLTFSVLSKEGKLYCSLLTQEALLENVFGKFREIKKDSGFIGSDHAKYVAHIRTYPPNEIDARIAADFRQGKQRILPITGSLTGSRYHCNQQKASLKAAGFKCDRLKQLAKGQDFYALTYHWESVDASSLPL